LPRIYDIKNSHIKCFDKIPGYTYIYIVVIIEEEKGGRGERGKRRKGEET
jgi:hypothetical protein